MSLPRELVLAVRRLDEAQLRRLLILARGLLIGSEGPLVEPEDLPGFPGVRYRQERVRCGRGCTACPHGPYWYAYWREAGRTRSQYIGRELPADVRRLLEQVDHIEHGEPGLG
ncbi:MAG: hypothetical protein M3N52_10585 [Actinomycetota bacterium]|nr:hypothetical protein [Actinomycetota bacterium]